MSQLKFFFFYQKLILVLAITQSSENRSLRIHPWKKLESKLETGGDQAQPYLSVCLLRDPPLIYSAHPV